MTTFMTANKRLEGICTILLLCTLAGCMSDLRWVEGPSLGEPKGDLSLKKAIVSDFYNCSEFDLPRGERLRKRASSFDTVSDVSEFIAESLKRAGVAAEYRPGCVPADLAEGEVLVRGEMFLEGPYESGCNSAYDAVFLATLLMLGGFFPSPVPWDDGALFTYGVEILDSRGETLLRVREGEIEGYYRHYFSSLWCDQDHKEEVSDELPVRMAASLASLFGARVN